MFIKVPTRAAAIKGLNNLYALKSTFTFAEQILAY